MEFIKNLIEQATKLEEENALTEQWHDVEGVSTQVGDYRISAVGYFDENELAVSLYNTETGEQYRAEVYKNGNQFDVSVFSRNGRTNKTIEDSELKEFLAQLTKSFMQQNYDRILTPPEDTTDEYDSYYNRRERMRQARDYRSEIEADY